MTAIAAVDTALWDILGKSLERAGLSSCSADASREDVMVYGHANGDDDR